MKFNRTVQFIFLICLLFIGVSFAADEDSNDAQMSSVEKFQQWLSDRDQQNQSQLQASANAGQQTQANASGGATDAVSQAAFKQMTDSAMPMTPEQIIKFKSMMQDTQLAAASSPGAPPKPISSTLIVNMAPGTTPPAIRMYQGFITSLVFVDSTGASWPLANYDLGNSNAFNVQWDKKSNVLMIQPMQAYTYANLAVGLEGMSTPVMLTLVPGQAQVDYRVDLRINGIGPNAKQSNIGGTMPSQADSLLLGVLDGIAPSGAKLLKVDGEAGQVWQLGDVFYLRTRFTVLSPGWINKMSSPDGMNAYKLQATPTILLSKYGKPVSVRVQEEEA